AAPLWRGDQDAPPELLSTVGVAEADAGVDEARAAAERALAERQPIVVEADVEGLPAGAAVSAGLVLGEPPLGSLQLLFPHGQDPSEAEPGKLATFAVRAAHALRASAQAHAGAGGP